MYGGFRDDTVDWDLRAQSLSMLRASATRSKREYASAGEEQLGDNAHRMRDDLEPNSFGAMLAAHWAQAAPEKYKLDYHDFVTAHERPHSRVPYPNYSVGTRGLPFDDQKVGDGRYRGSGLY